MGEIDFEKLWNELAGTRSAIANARPQARLPATISNNLQIVLNGLDRFSSNHQPSADSKEQKAKKSGVASSMRASEVASAENSQTTTATTPWLKELEQRLQRIRGSRPNLAFADSRMLVPREIFHTLASMYLASRVGHTVFIDQSPGRSDYAHGNFVNSAGLLLMPLVLMAGLRGPHLLFATAR